MKTTITIILLVASLLTLTACDKQETTPAVAPTAVKEPNPAHGGFDNFKATKQSQGKTYKNPNF